MTVNKTKLNLAYIQDFFKSKNLEVPSEIDLNSIFTKHDKFNDKGEIVEGGDGILQYNEIKGFFEELYSKSSKLGEAFVECVKDVKNKQDKEVLASPPDLNSLLDRDCLYYLIKKLESMGINKKNIDKKLLAHIIVKFDYSIDKNTDYKISLKEAKRHKDIKSLMNKDDDGKVIDTHILDCIVNEYINRMKVVDDSSNGA